MASVDDASAFGALVLPDDAGRPVRPRELWRERAVAFVFLRHWG